MGGVLGPGYGPHARGRIKEIELQQERERDVEPDLEQQFAGAIESDEDIVARRAEQHRREREAAATAAGEQAGDGPASGE
jgi:hypothetical protein